MRNWVPANGKFCVLYTLDNEVESVERPNRKGKRTETLRFLYKIHLDDEES